ncbi:MAG: hypothetical protein PVI98_02855 [Burkholderiales bacterium]|jgi:hypothetical protein
MMWLQGIAAVVLLAGAIYGWFVLQRKFRGDDEDTGKSKRGRRRNDDDDNELEAFITAYREGKVDPTMVTDGEESLPVAGQPLPAAAQSVAPAAAAATGVAAGAAPASTPAVPKPAPSGPGTLLRPEVKLAYLSFRTGLRDHHVFPNVRLGDLGFGLSVGTVDLLVCDSSFKYVAAIDVYTGEKPEDAPKSLFLERAGIKHLKFSSKAMPKPAQLRELIYGEAQP